MATQKQKSKAHNIARRAIKRGDLARPEVCQLCSKKPGFAKDGRSKIVGHHYAGYEHPLKVWWVCTSCNSKLKDERFHNGDISIEDVRAVIHKPETIVRRYFFGR